MSQMPTAIMNRAGHQNLTLTFSDAQTIGISQGWLYQVFAQPAADALPNYIEQVTITCNDASTLPVPSQSTDQLQVLDAINIAESTYFLITDPNYGVIEYWFNKGSGSDPGMGNLDIEVDIDDTFLAADVALAIQQSAANYGINIDASAGDGTFIVYQQVAGSTPQVFTDGGSGTVELVNTPGTDAAYIIFNDDGLYFWFDNGIDGGDPMVPGYSGREVFMEGPSDSADQVAQALDDAITESGLDYEQVYVVGPEVLFTPINGPTLTDGGTGFAFGTSDPIAGCVFFYSPGINDYYCIYFPIDGVGVAPYDATHPVIAPSSSSDDEVAMAANLVNALITLGYSPTQTGSEVDWRRDGFYLGNDDPFFSNAFGNSGWDGNGEYIIEPCKYFTVYDPVIGQINIYNNVQGVGTSPAQPGLNIPFETFYNDDAPMVVSKFNALVCSNSNLAGFGHAQAVSGGTFLLTNKNRGAATAPSVGTMTTGLILSVVKAGF